MYLISGSRGAEQVQVRLNEMDGQSRDTDPDTRRALNASHGAQVVMDVNLLQPCR